MRRAPPVLLAPLLTALLGWAGAAPPVPAEPPAPVPSPALPLPTVPDTVRLERISGPSFLRVPPACYVRECALVVVSHPRAQSAERLYGSPSVGVLVNALLAAPFAVLLSDDGGPNTWGSPAALDQVKELHTDAVGHFAWNGRTYALGLSMGGLLALRSALPGSPYRVSGTALIDGWADLREAWGTGATRRTEIEEAYGLPGEPDPRLNPLPNAEAAPPLPLFIVGSPDDKTVPLASNSQRLFARAEPGVSEFVTLTGPHLGGNRFSPTLAGQLTTFFTRLEAREEALGRR
ncbi:alpha/beta hydrolase [Deinococcus sp. YIM 134068]|uniref:alpha/beta hydrolase family protein n=1 Tax=Deinococcus lichenicola TaxID=3118910 RepID=UPI002F9239BC